jgi:hypothetical protein
VQSMDAGYRASGAEEPAPAAGSKFSSGEDRGSIRMKRDDRG